LPKRNDIVDLKEIAKNTEIKLEQLKEANDKLQADLKALKE
jgi:hypothetical protein